MSEVDKGNKNVNENKDFEFIKEQIVEKKRKKLKKRLLPILRTSFLAMLFGVIAAAVFVITEPKLYKFLHKEEEETKNPVIFPTQAPEIPKDEIVEKEDTRVTITPTVAPVQKVEEDHTKPDTVIQQITKDADIEDYINMNNEIRKIANEANKSLLNISSNFTVYDLFGNEVEKTINTSGVIVANNGTDFIVLVSLDNVQNANSIKVKFSDMVYVDAHIQDYESELNLAILAVGLKDVPKIYQDVYKVAVPGESYTLTVGTPVIALGNPNGHLGSMDIGIITSKGSWADVTDNRIDLFNTNMDSNAYSDGIIVNLEGQMVGLITHNLRDGINEELCTVIGISELLPIIEQMSNKEPRVCFGIKADDMTIDAKKDYEIENGIYVKEVLSVSPAFDAGIKNGDIILSVNDQTVVSIDNFYRILLNYKIGDQLSVKIKRGSTLKEHDLIVTLAEKVK